MIRTRESDIRHLCICIFRLGLVFAAVMFVGLVSLPAAASVVGPSEELGSSLGDDAIENVAAGSEGRTTETDGPDGADDQALFTTVTAPVRLSPPGDLDGSGMVDQVDLDLVLINWGRELETLPAAWIHDRPDVFVDQGALDLVLLNWGRTAAPDSPVAVVPEGGTASVTVLLLASVFFARTAYRTACRGIERMRSPVA